MGRITQRSAGWRKSMGRQKPPPLRSWPLFFHAGFLAVLIAVLFGGQTSFCLAADNWADSREVGPFVVRANFSLDRMDPLFRHLSKLQNDMVNHLGISPAQEKIELLLFRDEWTYRDYLRRNLANMPYRRALFIKQQQGPGTVLVHWSKDFEIDARHECTHALLHASLPLVPLWLDEGLAEYYEMPPSQRAYDSPHAKSLRWSLLTGGLADLSQLEKIVDFDKMSKADYRNAWAWVHFMLHGSTAARAELVQYLGEIESSKHPGSLSRRLAKRISRPTVRCANHHRNWKRK